LEIWKLLKKLATREDGKLSALQLALVQALVLQLEARRGQSRDLS
jgi:hypothetical protein